MIKLCGRILWDCALLEYRSKLQKAENGFVNRSHARRAKMAIKSIGLRIWSIDNLRGRICPAKKSYWLE